MVAAFVYPNNTGWIGFFIMSTPLRGKGLGRQLWKEMELTFRNAETTVIGLDAVEEQVKTYKRRGFVDCASIPLMMRESIKEKPVEVTWDHADAVELQDIRDVDGALLAKLDRDHTGLDRSAFWATDVLVHRRGTLGYAIVADGEVTGMILGRHCLEGVRIGPLYAATYAQARQMLQKLMNDYLKTRGTFAAEIFGSNGQGKRVFEDLGWTYVGLGYHRMWLNGKVPQEQQEGGKGAKGMFAIFDAGAG
jgi:hypothetical protein